MGTKSLELLRVVSDTGVDVMDDRTSVVYHLVQAVQSDLVHNASVAVQIAKECEEVANQVVDGVKLLGLSSANLEIDAGRVFGYEVLELLHVLINCLCGLLELLDVTCHSKPDIATEVVDLRGELLDLESISGYVPLESGDLRDFSLKFGTLLGGQAFLGRLLNSQFIFDPF